MNRALDWIKSHPRLTAWIVLALGMNAIVVYEARNVGLQAGQWGSYRDLLVVWWPALKEKGAQDEALFRRRLKEYATWVGLKQVVEEDAGRGHDAGG